MIRPSHFRPESTASPFFGLLADADEIQIREVHFEDRDQVIQALDKAQSDLRRDNNSRQSRSFIVHIKNEKLQEPAGNSSSPNDAYDARQLKRSADLLLESGDFLLARNLYSYLTRNDTRDFGSLRGLGICLLRLGEISSAKKCFRALCDETKADEPLAWMGLAYATESNDLAALDCFAKVAALDSLENRLRFDLFKSWGNSLTRLGRLKEAESRYRLASDIDPNSDVLHVNFGTLYLQDLQHRSARESFSRALALNPRNSRAHCGLGLVAVSEGERDEAQKHFVHSLDLDSQNLVALLQLFSVLQQKGDYSVVTPYLQQYLVRDPQNADVHYALAEALYSQASWKDCETHIESCLSAQPGHAQAQRLRDELKAVAR